MLKTAIKTSNMHLPLVAMLRHTQMFLLQEEEFTISLNILKLASAQIKQLKIIWESVKIILVKREEGLTRMIGSLPIKGFLWLAMPSCSHFLGKQFSPLQPSSKFHLEFQMCPPAQDGCLAHCRFVKQFLKFATISSLRPFCPLVASPNTYYYDIALLWMVPITSSSLWS